MNFIEEYSLKKIDLCDELIEFYQNSQDKFDGVSSFGCNPEVKKSTEIRIDLIEYTKSLCVKEYVDELIQIVQKYNQKYIFSSGEVGMVEPFKIQFYKPTEAYYEYHTERNTAELPYGARHLVFMTYLNDVTDGGETEFHYQEVKVKPKKGKTVIWPADWTHTHRGIPSPTQEKYIVTGWLNYTQGLSDTINLTELD